VYGIGIAATRGIVVTLGFEVVSINELNVSTGSLLLSLDIKHYINCTFLYLYVAELCWNAREFFVRKFMDGAFKVKHT
jgi:hypothetical protein